MKKLASVLFLLIFVSLFFSFQSPKVFAQVKPVPPTNLQPEGYMLPGSTTFSWNIVPGATSYSYRLDDRANPWTGTCGQINSGDLCVDNITARSFNYTLVAGHTYQFWVHANNSTGWSDATTVIIQAVTALPTSTIAPNPPLIPPPGKIVFIRYIDANRRIYTMNSDGTNEVQVPLAPNNYRRPTFTNDGKKILVDITTSNTQRDVYSVNIDGTNLQKIVGGGFFYLEDINKSNTKILYTPDTTGLYIADFNNSNPGLVTNVHRISNEYVYAAKFINNDTQIVYLDTSNMQVKRMNIDGTNETMIATGFLNLTDLSISPDEKTMIVGDSGSNGYEDIYVMNIDGTNKRMLFNVGKSLYGVGYSPDGTAIYFTKKLNTGKESVFISDLSGNNMRQLINVGANESAYMHTSRAWLNGSTPNPTTTQTPQSSCSTICQNAGFQCGSLQGCTCANTCTNGLVCSYNLCTPTTGTAMCSKPNIPTITTPSGTQMNGGAVTITWTPPTSSSTNTLGANFTHYAVRVDDLDDGNGFPGFDALPPDIVVDNIPKTQTSYTYLGAVPGHHYHIWVHAVNHPYNDCNQWSDPFEIGNIVAIAGATNTPTPTPTPTTGAPQATATIPPNCQYKTKGDADCNNVINVFDFQAWRNEISGTSTEKTADFDRNGVVTVLDFQIWRDGMVNPPPTLTPTPGTFGCTPSTAPQEVTTSITDVTTTTDYKQMIIKFRGRATNDTTITDTDFTAKVYGQYQNHSFGNAYNYSGSNPYLLVTFEGNGTGQIGTYAAGFLNVTIDGVSKKIYFPSFTIPDEASTISFYVGADGSTYYANSTHLTNSWFNNGLRQWQGYANSVNLSPLQAMVTAHRAVDSCTQN